MSRKILLVDDEPSVLQGYRRHLARRFDVSICERPETALELLDAEGPFAVVVSDYRMPSMNGVEFLKLVQERHPAITRVMLTGQADYEATLAAINEGRIFRFLNKPCPPDALASSIADALEVHELVMAEKELIEGTLQGAVAALTDLLGLASPTALDRATRIRSVAVPLAEQLGAGPVWLVDMAASLSQVGCMTLDDDVAGAGLSGEHLGPDDREMFETHAAAAERLLAKIPRLEPVGALVGAQFRRHMSPAELSRLGVEADLAEAFFGACAFVEAAARTDEERALALIDGGLTPRIHEALRSVVGGLVRRQLRPTRCTVEELLTGMVADQDIVTTSGVLLVSSGHEVTEVMLQRLRNFHRKAGVVEPIAMLTATA